MGHLFCDLESLVAVDDEPRAIWGDPESRRGVLQRLDEMGYDRERLDEMRRLIDVPNCDVFDVLAYVRFKLAPLARSEQVRGAKTAGWGGTKLK